MGRPARLGIAAGQERADVHAPAVPLAQRRNRRRRRVRAPAVPRPLQHHRLDRAEAVSSHLHQSVPAGTNAWLEHTLLDREITRIDALDGAQAAALVVAAHSGHGDVARFLLEKGADPNSILAGYTALHAAILHKDDVLVAALLAKDANPNTPVLKSTPVRRESVDFYFSPGMVGASPLWLAARYRAPKIMALLLEKGADPNQRVKKKVWYSGYNFDLSGVDEIGATPFWRAAYASDLEAMQLLIAHGADPEIPTMKPAGRPRTGDAGAREDVTDVSGRPPVPQTPDSTGRKPCTGTRIAASAAAEHP